MQTILMIGYVWPEPNSSAAGARTMALIRLFRQQGWQVIFATAAALSAHRADVAALGVREQAIALNCDSFDVFVGEYQPDLVVFDRFFTEEQFGWRVEKVCPTAVRVLDTIDFHSLREARHQLLKQSQQHCRNEAERYRIDPPAASGHWPQLRALMVGQDIAQREIASIYRSDLTLMISEVEMQLLQHEFGVPAALLHYCNLMLPETGATVPSTTRASLPFEQRQHFLSIGNFRHAPNWDSVLWLKHAIWPLIRRQLPDAQLHIAGAYPPPKATALHDVRQGFHVLGWVDDAQRVMAQARVCLAPLRFGAGIKGKLADAMACGTPSVTTTIGSESMCGADQAWGGAVCDSAEALAQAAIVLYQDVALWQQAQTHGTTILHTYFDPQIAQQTLLARLMAAVSQRDSLRQDNFVGSMLRHHLHKSTQYLSQWIVAKNHSLKI